MKRIAALAVSALALALTPAMASASTVHAPSRGFACPRPPHGQVKLVKPVYIKHRKGHYVVVTGAHCPRPVRLLCPPGVVRFDMPAHGRAITEVSGPNLQVGETIVYKGAPYAVASVSGAVFTMTASGQVLVTGAPGNNGTALALGTCLRP